jgi:hypothetical protein
MRQSNADERLGDVPYGTKTGLGFVKAKFTLVGRDIRRPNASQRTYGFRPFLFVRHLDDVGGGGSELTPT